MKNITVSIDDETYRRARMKAAKQDTSVSAMVRKFLVDAAKDETDEFERLRALETALRAEISGFSGADRLPRDELYDRRR
jgi:plasmid stability protein